MALTYSEMLPLGTAAPDFSLPDVEGNLQTLKQYRDKPLLVMFICNHCPFVIHLREALIAFAQKYQEKGLAIIAISANDVDAYPQDRPELMRDESRQYGYPFHYLYDESQNIAKAYKAACTPDFYLFDTQHKLVYRGRFDASTPGNNLAINGNDLINAVEPLLAGRTISSQQEPSMGCNIKWRPGNEPDYFS